MKDKYRTFYYAMQMEEGGRYYAYVQPITTAENIIYILARQKNLIWVNLCINRKQAESLVKMWNEKYKEENKFLFDFKN